MTNPPHVPVTEDERDVPEPPGGRKVVRRPHGDSRTGTPVHTGAPTAGGEQNEGAR